MKIVGGSNAFVMPICGRIGISFFGKSTVEADFSVIGWEKDEYQTALTNFSLERIFHCN